MSDRKAIPDHIPSHVTLEQATEAFKPVLALLGGLSPLETRELRWDTHGITIVAVPRDPDDKSARPASTLLPGEFAGDDARHFAELSYQVTVAVR